MTTTGNRIGRPPKATRQDTVVNLRTTSSDKARWQAAASVEGIGLSEFSRRAIEHRVEARASADAGDAPIGVDPPARDDPRLRALRTEPGVFDHAAGTFVPSESAGHVHLPADGSPIRVWTAKRVSPMVGLARSGPGPLEGVEMALRPAMWFGRTIDAWVSEGGLVAPAGGRAVVLDLTTVPGEARVEHLQHVEAWGVERWTRVDGSPSPNVLCRCVSRLASIDDAGEPRREGE